jgi:E3 ubiquitin-protein ligase BRE1
MFETLSRSLPSSPDVSELQGRVTRLLLAEKTFRLELEAAQKEKEQFDQRLEAATVRYMLAEKKLDRAKSAAVARLEQQARGGAGNESGSGIGSGDNSKVKSENADGVNGLAEQPGSNEDVKAAKEALAVSKKQSEQIDALAAESKSLRDSLTALNTKVYASFFFFF